MDLLTFVYFASALRDDLLDDEDWRAVEQQLLVNPRAGVVVTGAGGARKLRIRLAGRGKRGGARTIYAYFVERERIYFLLTYAKNEQADLSEEQKQSIRQRIARLQANQE
jgi:hypothetical protein